MLWAEIEKSNNKKKNARPYNDNREYWELGRFPVACDIMVWQFFAALRAMGDNLLALPNVTDENPRLI